MERLQKVIANSGYCSRRKAEEEITKGHVLVNHEVVKELGVKVNTGDLIEINGEVISSKADKVYILMNKPRGVITSTSDDKKRQTVVDLIDIDTRIYPVGRLDYDTTGVLILTNDGELANLLMHPKCEINKTYIAKTEGIVDGKAIHFLEHGVIIDGKKTSRATAKLRKVDKKANTSIVELTIHEGRNHQVKNMFEALGYNVIKLKREKYSFLDVNDLKSGEYRYLSTKEVKKLYNEVGAQKKD